MPHLVILYTPNLDSRTNMDVLCRGLADAMLSVRDEDGRQVFPTGGVRVLAYPAVHYAVADGRGDYGFLYLNLRMGRGRSGAVQQKVGRVVEDVATQHLAPVLREQHLGITLQVDEGPEVFDAKHSSLHPLFNGRG